MHILDGFHHKAVSAFQQRTVTCRSWCWWPTTVPQCWRWSPAAFLSPHRWQLWALLRCYTRRLSTLRLLSLRDQVNLWLQGGSHGCGLFPWQVVTQFQLLRGQAHTLHCIQLCLVSYGLVIISNRGVLPRWCYQSWQRKEKQIIQWAFQLGEMGPAGPAPHKHCLTQLTPGYQQYSHTHT